MDSDNLTPSQKGVALSLDEMKVRKGLVFNKHTGAMIGFVDLGKINQELDQLTRSIDSCAKNIPPSDQQAAEHKFVLMIHPVFKPFFSFPVAQYPTTHLSGERRFTQSCGKS